MLGLVDADNSPGVQAWLQGLFELKDTLDPLEILQRSHAAISEVPSCKNTPNELAGKAHGMLHLS